MSEHRDQWRSPHASVCDAHPDGCFIRRIDEQSDPNLAYFNERDQYDDGRDNGHVYTTRAHEDDECDALRPGRLQAAPGRSNL